MNKICAIGVYFGTLPKYFPLWLKSAQFNPKIDFFLVTDNELETTPENVKVINMTLEKMKQLAEDKLHMQISLDKPYKCCDFKIVYGTIFSDYVSEYQYWGHYDIDLIMGDLYGFMVKNNYQDYDRFMHLGHFSFYRNCKQVNESYMLPGSLVGSYKEVFTSPKIFAFDELLGLGNILITNNIPFFTRKIFADISCHYKRFKLSTLCCVNETVTDYKHQVFYWQNGKTYIHKGKVLREEYAYVHFQKRPNYSVDFDPQNVEGFYIGVNGFTQKDNAEINKKLIQTINPYPGAIYEFIETAKYKLGRFYIRIKAKLGMRK